MSTLEQRLQERGWFLKPEVLAEVSNKQGRSSDTHVMHSKLLHVDLRKRGIGMLPENILTQKVGHIQGPLIVQASEVVDVSRPSYNASNSGDGVLFCTLDDGRIKGSAVALKAASCPLSTQTAPGTKLLIFDAEIEHGLIILDTACIQVLGGRVDNLADAWEAQQNYTRVKRMNKVEINSMGPVFCPFDPSKKKQLVKGQFSMAFPAAVSSSPSGTGTDTLRTSTANAERTQSATETGSTLPATHPFKRDPPVGTEVAASLANAAKVKEKLQEKMSHDAAAYEARGGSGGSRGRGGGRRGRRRDDDPEDSGVMTMEQWEARQAGRAAPQGLHMDSDEQLARQLQAQLNAEAAEEARAQQPCGWGANMADALFSDRHTDQGPGGRRGREGRRGGRGCGRGRAHW
eukprot:jgi/Ulvmu1/12708/UM095_0012.1